MQISLETGNNTPICTYQNTAYLHAASNKLAIEINFDGFSFCAINRVGKLELLRVFSFSGDDDPANTSYNAFIEQALYFSRATLELEWKETLLFFTSNQFTIIPETVFSEETLAQSMHLLFDSVNHNVRLLQADLPKINAKIGYNLPNAILQGLKQYPHHNLKISSGIKGWLLFCLSHLQTNGAHVYLLVQGRQLYLSVCENRSFKFVNSFDFFEATDLAYFVLNTLQQIKLPITEVKFYLGGTLTQNDEHFKVLGEYLPNLIRLSPEQIYQVEDHEAFSNKHLLLANILCA